MENEMNSIQSKRNTLFRAAVAGSDVLALVRIMGSEYTAAGTEYRLRYGRIETLDTERGYVTLRLRDGKYRNTRIRDVLVLKPL